MQFRAVTNNAISRLHAAIDADDASLTLLAGGGANFPVSGPFYVTVYTNPFGGRERVRLSGRSGDVLSVAARGIEDTDAASWPAGAYVALTVAAGDVQELQDALLMCGKILSYAWGGNDGVVRNDGNTFFAVTPGAAALTLTVAPGLGFISHHPVELEAAWVSETLVPPTSGSRTDLIQYVLNEGIEVLEGSTDPSSNAIALASVTLTSGQTTITAGHITDMRNWL